MQHVIELDGRLTTKMRNQIAYLPKETIPTLPSIQRLLRDIEVNDGLSEGLSRSTLQLASLYLQKYPDLRLRVCYEPAVSTVELWWSNDVTWLVENPQLRYPGCRVRCYAFGKRPRTFTMATKLLKYSEI